MYAVGVYCLVGQASLVVKLEVAGSDRLKASVERGSPPSIVGFCKLRGAR